MTKFKMADPADLKDLYLPVMAEIKEVRKLTEMEMLYTVALPDGAELGHIRSNILQYSATSVVGLQPFVLH